MATGMKLKTKNDQGRASAEKNPFIGRLLADKYLLTAVAAVVALHINASEVKPKEESVDHRTGIEASYDGRKKDLSFENAIIKDPKNAMKFMNEFLTDSSIDVKLSAANIVARAARMDPEAVLPEIMNLAISENPENRIAAMLVYGKTGNAEVVKHLIRALNDDMTEREAAFALIEIGVPSVPTIINALRISDQRLAERLALVLGEIRHPDAVPALINALHNHDANVRGTAAAALGKIGDASALDALFNVRENDDSEAVRQTAGWAILTILHPHFITSP